MSAADAFLLKLARKGEKEHLTENKAVLVYFCSWTYIMNRRLYACVCVVDTIQEPILQISVFTFATEIIKQAPKLLITS